MSETILNQRRALRRAVARAVFIVATFAFASPFAVSAQATAKAAPQSSTQHFPSYLFVPQAHYGAPLDAAIGAALLVPTKPWRCEDGFCGADGIEVQAMAGIGGWRVAAGVASIAFPFSADALVTVTRTGSTPRRASPDSTYLGGEGGFSIPVVVKRRAFVSVRPSIGFARRINGAGASADRANWTWNIGVLFMRQPF